MARKIKMTDVIGLQASLTVSLSTLTDAAPILWDCNSGYRQKVSISNTVGTLRGLTISNYSAGQFGVLMVTHTGSNTQITLPGIIDATFKWGSVANDVTLLSWFYDGTAFRWSSVVYGTPVSPNSASLENLAISTSTNVTNTNNTYTQTTPSGSFGGGTILFAKKLASGTNGYVQQTFTNNTSNTINAILGLKDTAVQGAYATFKVGFWNNNGGIGIINNGSAVEFSLTTISPGDIFAIFREGSAYYLRKSSNGGSTWSSNLYTFGYTGSGDMYAVADIQDKLVDPKAYNFI